MHGMLKYSIAFTLAAVAGLAAVQNFKEDHEEKLKNLVSCDKDEICHPKGLYSIPLLEKDLTVIHYAQQGKCDKMTGNAYLACTNINP